MPSNLRRDQLLFHFWKFHISYTYVCTDAAFLFPKWCNNNNRYYPQENSGILWQKSLARRSVGRGLHTTCTEWTRWALHTIVDNCWAESLAFFTRLWPPRSFCLVIWPFSRDCELAGAACMAAFMSKNGKAREDRFWADLLYLLYTLCKTSPRPAMSNLDVLVPTGCFAWSKLRFAWQIALRRYWCLSQMCRTQLCLEHQETGVTDFYVALEELNMTSLSEPVFDSCNRLLEDETV